MVFVSEEDTANAVVADGTKGKKEKAAKTVENGAKQTIHYCCFCFSCFLAF